MAKKPVILPPTFSTSTCCHGATLRSTDKVECGSTTTNLPLSNGIKSISILKHLYDEVKVISTTSTIQKRDGQTNNKTSNFFAPSGKAIED